MPDVAATDAARLARDTIGAAWSHAGEQLNVTVLSWGPGHVVAEHVNDEREVLLVGIDGSGQVTIDDDDAQPLGPGVVVVVPRGARRSVRSGTDGLAYVSAHQARGLLQVTRRA